MAHDNTPKKPSPSDSTGLDVVVCSACGSWQVGSPAICSDCGSELKPAELKSDTQDSNSENEKKRSSVDKPSGMGIELFSRAEPLDPVEPETQKVSIKEIAKKKSAPLDIDLPLLGDDQGFYEQEEQESFVPSSPPPLPEKFKKETEDAARLDFPANDRLSIPLTPQARNEIKIAFDALCKQWDDDGTHRRFMKACTSHGGLELAGLVYREVLEKKPNDSQAIKWREKIAELAVEMMTGAKGITRSTSKDEPPTHKPSEKNNAVKKTTTPRKVSSKGDKELPLPKNSLLSLPVPPNVRANAEAHWKALLDEWEDDDKHKAFIQSCSSKGGIELAAITYRNYLNVHPGDSMAKKWQKKVADQAALLLTVDFMGSSTLRKELTWTPKVIILTVLLLCGLTGFFAFVFMSLPKWLL